MSTAPEERIGAAVAAWFQSLSHDTYAEVVLPNCTARPDLVAVTRVPEPCVSIVECKVRFGLDVLRQVRAWDGWAHAFYVATRPVCARNMEVARDIVAAFGLGWLTVDGDYVRIVEHPDRHRGPRARRARLTFAALRAEHRDVKPGNARSEYHTAEDETRRKLAEAVAREPGVPLRRALAASGVPGDGKTLRMWAAAIRKGQVNAVAGSGAWTRMVLTPTQGGEF